MINRKPRDPEYLLVRQNRPVSLSLDDAITARCRQSLTSIASVRLSNDALYPSMCSTPGTFSDNAKQSSGSACAGASVFTYPPVNALTGPTEPEASVATALSGSTSQFNRPITDSDLYHSAQSDNDGLLIDQSADNSSENEVFHTPMAVDPNVIPTFRIVPPTVKQSRVHEDDMADMVDNDGSSNLISSSDREHRNMDALPLPKRSRNRKSRDSVSSTSEKISSGKSVTGKPDKSSHKSSHKSTPSSIDRLRNIKRLFSIGQNYNTRSGDVSNTSIFDGILRRSSFLIPIYTPSQGMAVGQFYGTVLEFADHVKDEIPERVVDASDEARGFMGDNPVKQLRFSNTGPRPSVSVSDIIAPEYIEKENRRDGKTLRRAGTRHQGQRYSIGGESYYSPDGADLCYCHKLFLTICLALVLFTVTMSLSLLGPTLLEFEGVLLIDTRLSSYLITVRAVGGVAGAVIFGLTFDRFNRYILFAAFLLGAGLMTVLLVTQERYASVMAVIFFQGLFIETLDMGSVVMCMSMWGLANAPYIQTIHFFDSVGYIIAPLLASPFVTDDLITPSCNNITSSNGVNPSKNITMNLDLSSCEEIQNQNQTFVTVPVKDFKCPYFIAGALFTTLGFIYVIAWLTLDRSCRHTKHTHATEKPPILHSVSCLNRVICIAAGLLHCCHFGVVNTYHGFLVLYMVKGLGWTKSSSLVLATVHYSFYCLARIMGILLSKFIRPSVMVSICLLLAELAFILDLTLWPSWDGIPWVSSITLGMTLSLVVPSSFTWIRSHMEITGKAAAVIRLISTVGLSGVPALLGNLFHKYGAVTFDATLLTVNCMSLFTFLMLYLVLKRWRFKSAKYSTNSSSHSDLYTRDINSNVRIQHSSASLSSVFQ